MIEPTTLLLRFIVRYRRTAISDRPIVIRPAIGIITTDKAIAVVIRIFAAGFIRMVRTLVADQARIVPSPTAPKFAGGFAASSSAAALLLGYWGLDRIRARAL